MWVGVGIYRYKTARAGPKCLGGGLGSPPDRPSRFSGARLSHCSVRKRECLALGQCGQRFVAFADADDDAAVDAVAVMCIYADGDSPHQCKGNTHMINTDNLNSCIDLANGASADLHRTMLYTMQQMADRIDNLERRLRDLEDDYDNAKPSDRQFEDRVIEVLEVRSGSCRAALALEDQDVERCILSTIEENSYTVFTHIEAELEEKLDAMTQGYAFAEAVKEAVEGSIVQTVEEIIEERISPDLLGADAEDVVRKGLRHLI